MSITTIRSSRGGAGSKKGGFPLSWILITVVVIVAGVLGVVYGPNISSVGRTTKWTWVVSNVREGRGTRFSIVRTLPAGTRVSSGSGRTGWSAIWLDGSRLGYIANSLLHDGPPEVPSGPQGLSQVTLPEEFVGRWSINFNGRAEDLRLRNDGTYRISRPIETFRGQQEGITSEGEWGVIRRGMWGGIVEETLEMFCVEPLRRERICGRYVFIDHDYLGTYWSWTIVEPFQGGGGMAYRPGSAPWEIVAEELRREREQIRTQNLLASRTPLEWITYTRHLQVSWNRWTPKDSIVFDKSGTYKTGREEGLYRVEGDSLCIRATEGPRFRMYFPLSDDLVCGTLTLLEPAILVIRWQPTGDHAVVYFMGGIPNDS